MVAFEKSKKCFVATRFVVTNDYHDNIVVTSVLAKDN